MADHTLVRKAVVPVAGLGTRHFPASHAVKKELFPIVGVDGIARALLHYHLLELAEAGFEEICLIVQPGEEAVIRSYLQGPGRDCLKRLEKYPALLQEAGQMRRLAKQIRFAVQREQEGYGHAVFQSREFAAGEMVLLCLGDHLFRGQPVSPCRQLAQMAGAGQGRSISAVNRISAAELKGYGTIAGTRRPENPRLIDVSLIVEKPDPALARAQLRVNDLPEGTWLGWFGLHLLAPSIYDVLAQMIRDNVRDQGEFQLTRAQEIQRQREGYLALEMTEAQRFDFGTPDDFVRSVAAFRQAV
ncbi:MAG TPA: sugar phosphate nucleotidyltransferase [Candidatus Acidoferrum sp.]|nr:sugar phosphate nucleotidyltransferase [Candidatus Acidoferrum sp.]